MKFKPRFVALCAAAVAAIAVAVYMAVAMRGKRRNVESEAESAAASHLVRDIGAKGKKTLGQAAKRRTPSKRSRRSGMKPDVGTDPTEATAEVEIGDEEPMTEQQKAVSKELQTALDGNDLKAVRRTIAKFKASSSRGGLGGNVTKGMRRQAVQALGWFGKDGAIDVIDFLGDADDEIAADAYDLLELAISGGDMSQAECSTYLKSIMTALTDTERIDNLLFNLSTMDNSVKADTIRDILANGTDAAKKVMHEQLEFYTDVGVETIDDVARWAVENPD